MTTLVGATAAGTASAVPPSTRSRTAAPFTRNSPVNVPLSRNTVLTVPGSAKEVRQFGFDISEHAVTYSVGDALGVCATNSEQMVTKWLAATGLSADDAIEVDGTDMRLGDALTSHYDICRITPNPLDFVTEAGNAAGSLRTLRRNRSELDKWIVSPNEVQLTVSIVRYPSSCSPPHTSGQLRTVPFR